MSNVHILYADNDTVLEVDRLRNGLSGEFLNTADVSVTLLEDDGTPVDGVSWPLSLAYVSGTEGLYRVTIPYTLGLVPNRRYLAELVADDGPGLHSQWEVECVARKRT